MKTTDLSFFEEQTRKLPARSFDVVVAGGGTAGVVAAIAAARRGAKTILIESKGYPGGVAVEGGTAIHSFYNLWKAFPGVEKRQVVRGIPAEMIERLVGMGGCTGYPEMHNGFDYDSVCTVIDTELYKLNAFEMLVAAGVYVCVNTLLVGAVCDGAALKGVILESRSGREVIYASSFVDCTGYGDLAAHAGAPFTEPNDYAVANSMGLGNVDIERFYEYLKANRAVGDLCFGMRSGKDEQIIRLGGDSSRLPEGFHHGAEEIGMTLVTTTVHDRYCMFIKLNLMLSKSPTDRDEVARAELVLRQRMHRGAELFRQYIPGFENAFVARTSPSLCIRRGRLIDCDYDISHEDVVEARHFNDDTFVYGFHDFAPRIQIKDGGTYGIPYRALCARGLENLYVTGMMITSDHRAHMSTRNTVSCMGQGQAAGTAAALCAERNCGARDLPYTGLRSALVQGGVYFE
jgi:hypothetical protein